MKKRLDWLRIFVHLGTWITVCGLTALYFTNTLSVNPILTLEHQTGKAALIFLMLSLSCTPLSAILDWKNLGKRKKALGLYGFMFASFHLLIFIGLDYGFRVVLIGQIIKNTVYIWFGLAAFILLLALAVTSFKKMKQLLKKNWKRLHRMVYIISPLVIVHFLLVLKGNFFRMQGNIREPLIYGSIVLVLLILRIPVIKRSLINSRIALQSRISRPNPL